MQDEIWKDIAGYEGSYQISDRGVVRGLDRVDSSGRSMKGTIKKQCINSVGYLMMRLCSFGVQKSHSLHVLLANAFIGPRQSGMVVDHIDNNKLNNKLINLQYITHRLNSSKDRKCISGITGVQKTASGKYQAKAYIGGGRKCLGTFETKEQAGAAYQEATILRKDKKHGI